MPPDGSHGDTIMLHGSITPERICQAVQRVQTSLDNPGFCTDCGAEADGVEPDAEGYECESCGAEDLLIRIM